MTEASAVVPGRATIVMPSYNHERYVADAITSVLDQTYADVELVVVDDGSSDGTVAAIEAIRRERPFTFLKNERNRGLNPTLRRAFAASTGSFISMLASDDMILPDKIAKQIALLEQRGADVVYARATALGPDGVMQPITLPGVARDAANGTLLARAYTDDTGLPLVQSALFRRAAWDALDPLRDDYRLDDWIYLIGALERFKVEFLDEPTFVYRQHDTNTHQNYERTFGMRMEVALNGVPVAYRRKAMARIFATTGQYYAWDSRYWRAAHYAMIAQVIRPSLRNLLDVVRAAVVQLRRDVRAIGVRGR